MELMLPESASSNSCHDKIKPLPSSWNCMSVLHKLFLEWGLLGRHYLFSLLPFILPLLECRLVFKILIYFIWLPQVLVVAYQIFFLGMWTLNCDILIAYGEWCQILDLWTRLSFKTRDQAWSLKSFCVAEFY